MTNAPLHPPSLTFPISLSQDIQNTINSEVINHNIKCAMFSFKPHKAPSLDKFHPVFFQRYWIIVSLSVISYIKNIFQTKMIPDKLNDTLICLILKMDKPKTVHQF